MEQLWEKDDYRILQNDLEQAWVLVTIDAHLMQVYEGITIYACVLLTYHTSIQKKNQHLLFPSHQLSMINGAS